MNKKDFFLPALLYDSECTLCTRFKQALERLPKGDQICMLSIRDNEIYQQFPELDPKECHDTVHLIDEDHKIHKGPQVVTYLAEFYPGIQKFAWLLKTQMGQKAVSLFYEAVNDYRKSNLNKCKECK